MVFTVTLRPQISFRASLWALMTPSYQNSNKKPSLHASLTWSSDKLKTHISFNVPGKQERNNFQQTGSLWRETFLFLTNGLFIHSFIHISQSSQLLRNSPTIRGKHSSPSTETHVDVNYKWKTFTSLQ
jgi:hypothetical protein